MKITNAIAIALLVLCFVLSLGRIALRRASESESGTVTIRFAHWQLESGLRDAFDQIAADYMELHPGVRVKQLIIPERVFPNWAVTQMIGGTAPDLMELEPGKGTEGDRIGRFFLPLSEYVEKPNPYNAGTQLEHVPWQQTFIDGLIGPPAFDESLLEVYGIPNTIHTSRIFYNRELLEKITGRSDAEPKTYGEFIALCEQVRAYARRTGERIVPLSGSRYNAPFLMGDLASSQMQGFSSDKQPIPILFGSQEEIFLSYLADGWSLDDRPIQLSLQIQQDVGQYFQPGFLQLSREDSMLYFVQGRALMMLTGSWDFTSILAQAPFPVGAFRLPYPDRDDPKFGANVVGQPSEAGARTGLAFGVIAASPHAEVAVDFLRYLTSQAVSQKFTNLSRWQPAVVGVEIPEAVKPFEPRLQGELWGSSLTMRSGETERVYTSNIYRLFQPGGTSEDFTAAIASEYRRAVAEDLRNRLRSVRNTLARQDVTLAANVALADGDPASTRWAKVSAISESQTSQEVLALYLQNSMPPKAATPSD